MCEGRSSDSSNFLDDPRLSQLTQEFLHIVRKQFAIDVVLFKESFENKVGGSVVTDVRFDSGERNLAPLVEKAFSGNPDAVYLAATFEAANPIFKEWRSRGYGGKFFVSPDVVVPESASWFSGPT